MPMPVVSVFRSTIHHEMEDSDPFLPPVTVVQVQVSGNYREYNAISLKQQLIRQKLWFQAEKQEENLQTGWLSGRQGRTGVNIYSSDPTCGEFQKLKCRAAILCTIPIPASLPVLVTDSTLVHVHVRDTLLGLDPIEAIEDENIESLYNDSTPGELLLHLESMLLNPTWVGTSHNALVHRHLQEHRQAQLRIALGLEELKPEPRPIPRPRFLLVHSSEEKDRKADLIVALAQRRLGAQVHVLRPGPLIARYGVHADAALSMTVHQIVVSASMDNHTTVVVLDHCQDMIQGPKSHKNTAMRPIYQGMLAYLRQLTSLLHRRQEVPFPTNALYNAGDDGCELNASVAFIAVETCDDNDKCLELLTNVTRYRFPTLSATTRQNAFSFVLRKLQLSTELAERLPLMASAAVSLGSNDFRRITQHLEERCTQPISCADFQNALRLVSDSGDSIKVSFEGSKTTEDLFSSVGGNLKAKAALEDALAMDPKFRARMKAAGIQPFTGVLLYGPPGTGKTLLARSVAQALGDSTGRGGAFVSIKSTDVARAEVGNGEKMLKRAFETARMNSPSVIFIDEFQALFVERGRGGSSRLTTTLMICMDDVKRWRDLDEKAEGMVDSSITRIVVLAATNTPWMIDKSFLRPGRFDKSVKVGLPTENERVLIFMVHVKKMRTSLPDIRETCTLLAQKAEGFSGADIVAAIQEAAVQCVLDGRDLVLERDLLQSTESHRPTSDETLLKRIDDWRVHSF